MPATADEQRAGDDEQRAAADERRDETAERRDGESDREHELRKEATRFRREARAARQEADRLRADAERRRVETESETERATREAVEAKEVELRKEFAAERLHNRLRIRAVGKLRDPDDAVLHLADTLDPDADNAAVDAAIDELIKQRDYLAAPPANGATTGELVTQGARSTERGRSGEQTPDDWIRRRARGA